jgi:hypothetical protein
MGPIPRFWQTIQPLTGFAAEGSSTAAAAVCSKSGVEAGRIFEVLLAGEASVYLAKMTTAARPRTTTPREIKIQVCRFIFAIHLAKQLQWSCIKQPGLWVAGIMPGVKNLPFSLFP